MPARAAPVRYWRPAGPAMLLAALPLILIVPGTFLVPALTGAPQAGLILAGTEVLAIAVIAGPFCLLVEIRGEVIRVWHGLKVTSIAVSEVAGVGMLFFHKADYGGDWRLCLWRDCGPMEATEFAVHVKPTGRSWEQEAAASPAGPGSPGELTASRAAAAARDIAGRVLARRAAAECSPPGTSSCTSRRCG